MTRRPSQMDVGRAIRHILAETGANLARVARGAGLSTAYLGALSRGERIPSLPTLEDIAHALGVPLFVLAFYGTDDPRAEPAPGLRAAPRQGPAAGQRQRRGRASIDHHRSICDVARRCDRATDRRAAPTITDRSVMSPTPAR